MNKSGNAGAVLTLFLFVMIGLLLLLGPFFLPPSVALPGASKLILSVLGAIILFVGTIGLIITKLYVKTKPDQVFVRTGLGGSRVVVDGGSIVIPVIHELKWIPTNTFQLKVDRLNENALITSDFLRADVEAVFYVHIQKEDANIQKAAASLPNFADDHQLVEKLVYDKLVSALRTVSATQTLQQLNADRAAFAESVQKIVQQELEPNGLTLESVTISKLDQAPLDAMRPETNVFDAQGAKTIAAEVQTRRVERNKIEQEAEQQIAKQNAESAKLIATQSADRAKALAEAEAAQRIAVSTAAQDAEQQVLSIELKTRVAKATADQEAATKEAEQRKLAEVANAEADQAIQIAKVTQEQQVAVAQRGREMAENLKTIESQQAAEIAKRNQAIAVAEAEEKRANAEAAQLLATKDKEAAAQAVVTVTTVAEAERSKQKAIIDQEAITGKRKIELQTNAEIAAYAQVKEAEGASAAAEKQAQATITAAEADKTAKILEAEGNLAVSMVPINASREQVGVNQAQVDVDIAKLRGESENATISLQREIALAAINAWKESQMAQAQAFGEALGKANMTIWGDPSSVEKMSSAFMNGQKAGMFVDGLKDGLPGQLSGLVEGVMNMVGNLGSKDAKATANPSEVPEIAPKAEEVTVVAPTKVDKPKKAESSDKAAGAQED